MEKNTKKWRYICVKLSHFTVWQRLAQCCKSTYISIKNNFFLIKKNLGPWESKLMRFHCTNELNFLKTLWDYIKPFPLHIYYNNDNFFPQLDSVLKQRAVTYSNYLVIHLNLTIVVCSAARYYTFHINPWSFSYGAQNIWKKEESSN